MGRIMKNDILYNKLKERMYEVSSVPPQSVGKLTPVWKKVAPVVKDSPIRVLLAGGFITTVLTWFLFGTLIIRLVSLLQYGF